MTASLEDVVFEALTRTWWLSTRATLAKRVADHIAPPATSYNPGVVAFIGYEEGFKVPTNWPIEAVTLAWHQQQMAALRADLTKPLGDGPAREDGPLDSTLPTEFPQSGPVLSKLPTSPASLRPLRSPEGPVPKAGGETPSGRAKSKPKAKRKGKRK